MNKSTLYLLLTARYIQVDSRVYFVITYCFKAVNKSSDDLYWAENSRKMLDCIGP